MTIKYTEFAREPISSCNICRQVKKLTWDHIPPEGSISLGPVEQENLFRRYTVKPNDRLYRISQNGVKFRTLCSTCNNNELGKRLDPILNKFSKYVGSLLKSKPVLPDIIEIETKPSALTRAVLGHILAAKTCIDNTVMDQTIREFVFDYSQKIPENVHLFYWIYPYNNVVILRDVAMPAIRGCFKNVGFFSILKSFPIAYLLTDLSSYEGLLELTKFRNLKVCDDPKVRINFRNIKLPEWPDNIDEGNFLAGGISFKSSVYAIPRNKKRG